MGLGLKDRSGKYVKLITYLVVIVLVNLVGLTLFFRLDMTENSVYSISEASQNVVSTLSEPLTINVFFTKNLPAPYNTIERYLHDLLEEYAVHGNRYFNYSFYDVSPEAESAVAGSRTNQSLASDYGIHPVQIQHVEEDEVKFKRAHMGLVLIHGDVIERITTITTTEGLEYKLTTAIQKLNNKISAFRRLEEKIQIKMFLSSALDRVAPMIGLRDLPGLPGEIRKIVDELNGKNHGKLAFSRLDPTENQRDAIEAAKHKLVNLKWPALQNGRIPSGTGTIGLVMEYREKVLVVQLLSVLRIPIIGTQYHLVNLDELEEIISGNLESLIDINENLGYLADNGTLEISAFSGMSAGMGQNPDALSNFRSLVSQSYTIKDVKFGQAAAADRYDSLVIAHPTEAFTDYELYQIDQMLMSGTSLAILMNAFNEIQQPNQQQFGYNQGPTFVPNRTGLEKLLEHWGVRVKQAIAMDENCFKQQLPSRFGGGERSVYFAPIIKSRNIDQSTNFMNNIKGLVAFKMSPLEIDEARLSENKLTARKLFSSSERSWEMTGNINLNPMFIQPPSSDDEKQSLPLAYLLEGEFPSYFKGKPMPERLADDDADGSEAPDDSGTHTEGETGADKEADPDLSKIEGEAAFLEKSTPARVLIIGSAEVLKDNILDPTGENPNAMFIMNALDALNQREDIAVMRSKVQRFNPLDDSDPMTKTFVKTFNIAGLPVLVVFFGLVVWFGRHARKKRIRMIFQK